MKRFTSSLYGIASLIFAILFVACTIDEEPAITTNDRENGTTEQPGGNEDDDGGYTDDNSATMPDNDGGSADTNLDMTIEAWTGDVADDAAADIVGSDNDFFYEANSFPHRVEIEYSGTTAVVTTSTSDILYHQQGAYVTVDMLTNSLSGVEIAISGRSDDGGLKIYGDKKFRLSLNGVDLRSQRGPAINSQCKKRVFIVLGDGTTNRLTDCATYTDDTYTLSGSYNEDRKGALFTEGNIILGGHGALVVAGKYKHSIVTDGCYYQRPGTTVVIAEAAKNGIHVKGDSDDGTGAYIAGGMVCADIASTAGKGIKSDMDVVVAGGKLRITTSGNGTYDSEEADTSAAACIKSDGSVYVNGGELTLTSSGSGGKGISADTDIFIGGGIITVATTGGQYTYSSYTSSPKGVKADGNITISGGKLNITTTGRSDGSEGLESKATLTFDGGETIINAYDDAVNAASAIVINDGYLYAYASNNDGIDANGTLTLNGGVAIGVGSTAPEAGIDVDNGNNFRINGGVAIALGGTLQSTPSTASTQRSVAYGGVNATQGSTIAVLDSVSQPLLAFDFPRTLSGASFFFSTPQLDASTTYSIASGGVIEGYVSYWQGWYNGGSWTQGTTLTTFMPTNIVTTIGSSGGGPGGGGPGGGGRPR